MAVDIGLTNIYKPGNTMANPTVSTNRPTTALLGCRCLEFTHIVNLRRLSPCSIVDGTSWMRPIIWAAIGKADHILEH
jgi:hypothetical protein